MNIEQLQHLLRASVADVGAGDTGVAAPAVSDNGVDGHG